MLRIEITNIGEHKTLFLVGDLRATEVGELAKHLHENAPTTSLNLSELKVIDLTAVRFLLDWEDAGIEIFACPLYVQEWMRRERRRRPD
jgi:ABC-type transporter Mla MlaB component